MLPYFDWGVIITRLIMTGESLFGGFIITRDTGTSIYLCQKFPKISFIKGCALINFNDDIFTPVRLFGTIRLNVLTFSPQYVSCELYVY